MSVYNPTGSGGVHTDRVISGGRKGKPVAKGMGFKAAAASVAKKSGMPAKQAAAVIAAGARKAGPAAKKANPNLKKVKGNAMADVFKVQKAAPKVGRAAGAMCAEPPKATKTTVRKGSKASAPMQAYGEVGTTTARSRRLGTTDQVRKSIKKALPSQSRISRGQPTVGRGNVNTTGSGMN